MRSLIFMILTVVILGIGSCSRSSSFPNKELDNAERLMPINKDSAMAILENIDPTDIKLDSVLFKYQYLKAWGHMHQNRSMIADSLIEDVHNYYHGKDLVRDIRTATALAWYKFWVGNISGSIFLLDSLVNRPGVPDSLMVQILRMRTLLGASEYQGEPLIPLSKRLISIEPEPKRRIEAKYMLVNAYENAEKLDSALALTEEIIEYARNNNLGELHFQMKLERAQILSELGRYNESEEEVAYIFHNAGAENGAADYLHMISAMNALNAGNLDKASKELALADSLALKMRPDEDVYYRSYSSLIHTIVDFKRTGKMKLKHVNGLNNGQRGRFNRMKASQWEAERGALEQQSRALALKTESQRKTVMILIIALISILLLALAGLIIRQRRLRELENEERTEALQKMVEELQAIPRNQSLDDKTPSALRRAMLQQLGIIKMVAETPTEQNREMLRKISSIERDTNGELVNWDNVYEFINTLYYGFYDKLHSHYGETLNAKEEQIIVLLIAGFSTKEISVITGQTTSTIYVRKSSIRKKLGMPEKEDIVEFLNNHLDN